MIFNPLSLFSDSMSLIGWFR